MRRPVSNLLSRFIATCISPQKIPLQSALMYKNTNKKTFMRHYMIMWNTTKDFHTRFNNGSLLLFTFDASKTHLHRRQYPTR
jgi:hypothetical protein